MRITWKAEELVPGARVVWRHFTNTDEPETRTGEVWDRGPDVDGARAVAWVKPDEPKPYDLYELIAVGIASRRHTPAHGWRANERPGDYARTGELYSSSLAASPLGGLSAFALQQAHKARKQKGAS